jgi:uncharacterized membrane protein (DUF4010 family)
MNMHIQAVVGVLIAALGGLAVGLEREWSGHATGPKARFAGVRTFTLLGAFAGLSGWLWSNQFRIPAVVLLIGAMALIVAAYISASRRDSDATTEVAALVIVAAGFTAAIGGWALAGGVVTVTTLLLVEKSWLHDVARRLDDTSLRAAVRFGVMAVVILPLLPNGPFGPWGGIRPRTLWIVVLLFSGLSFMGHLARRWVKGSSGYSIAGIVGGVISSTAVSFNFSRLSKSDRGNDNSLAFGVIGASTVLFVRVSIAITALNAGLARVAIPLLGLPFAVGAVATSAGMWLNSKASTPKNSDNSNPLEFWKSLQMAAVFQGVFYVVHWLNQIWGDRGLVASGAIVGFTDVDALVLSMARGPSGASLEIASIALVVGILSNTILKLGIVLAIGRGRYRWLAAGGLTLISVALVISIAFFGKW